MRLDERMPSTIDDYIRGCPKEVRGALQKIRATIREAAPGAQEKLSLIHI